MKITKSETGAPVSRRGFLKGAVVAPAIVPASVFGAQAPSNRVHLAALGVGGRGTAVTKGINEHPDARIIAVCDCYEDRMQKKKQEWDNLYGGDYVKMHSDPRDVFARGDIDAVVVATPDHWHVPLAIMAAKAGKDMYVEKPLGVALKWAWRLREESKKRNFIFQYGTQQRSSSQFRYACELARNGYLGKLERIEVWCPDASQQWGSFGNKRTFSVYRYGSLRPAPVPDGLDYELWCGPSPVKPYTVDRCISFGTYHIHDYALGFIAGWGAHPLDIAQWGMDADNGGPVFYEGTGNLPTYGLVDTVDEWDIHCYYPDGVVMRFMDFRVAKETVMAYRKGWSQHGTTFFGSEGWISVDRGGLEASRASLLNVKFSASDKRLPLSDHHQKNFVDCVKSRQPAISPLEAAIRSDTISHLSDMVVRLRRPIEWDPATEAIKNDNAATKMLDRAMRKKWAV